MGGKHRSIDPQPKADAGRGRAPEQLGQAVVAAAAGQRLLLPLAAGDEELKGGAGVVVEAPNQAVVDLVAETQPIEQAANGGEVCGTGVTQVVERGRGARRQLGVEALVVEHAEGVDRAAVAESRRSGAPRSPRNRRSARHGRRGGRWRRRSS